MSADLIQRLRDVTQGSIRSAGPRYSPGFAPGSPNLSIESLDRRISALALTTYFRERMRTAADELRENRRSRGYLAESLFGDRVVGVGTIADDLDAIAVAPESAAVRLGFRKLRRDLGLVSRRLSVEREQLQVQLTAVPAAELDASTGEGRPTRRSQINSRLQSIEELNQTLYPVREVADEVEGSAGPDGNPILLLGEWGTGKTHFVCDFALHALSDGVPAVAVLAPSIGGGFALDEIAAQVGLADAADLLRQLDDLALAGGRRAVILIDAINEGDRAAWRAQLPRVLRELRPYKNVALLLTCRTPFDQQVISDQVRKSVTVLYHPGFEEQEFDAQLEFFDFCKLPALHVPLLSSEFARPLFLKLLCEGLVRLGKRAQKNRLDGISSGQKGMTFVLENFVMSVGEEVETRHSIPRKTCWFLLKGRPERGEQGVAGRLADLRREWLAPQDVIDEIRIQTQLSEAAAANLLNDMVAAGLLVEQLRYASGGYVEALALPYQRFSDHLVARHLLAAHLDVGSESRLRRSFYSNRRLGAVFMVERFRGSFAEPGVASALMVEFPERVKRLQDGSGVAELLDYLPRGRRLLHPFLEAFAEGLYWRDAPAFGVQTERLVALLVARKEFNVVSQTFEVLVGLAARHHHPWNAAWLWNRLASMTMPGRDLKWSEFVRMSDESSNISRLLAWAERPAALGVPRAVAENLLRLLAALTTTTQRLTRDRATRAMVYLGEVQPDVLFALVREAVTFNDPYVGERTLAAAYGVAMRTWGQSARHPQFDESLQVLARQLISEMLIPGGALGTWHALTRSYAEGIVRIAGLLRPRAIRPSDRAILKRVPLPRESPFRRLSTITDDDVADGESTMHMDFENYTMGRLVDDRQNYDMSNPTYVAIRRQIADRIGRLGYRREDFEEADRLIARFADRGRDGARTDRYGKKYSWIAYFEMFGIRSRSGLLRDYPHMEPRSTDVDVDPSFPPEPPQWAAPVPDVFATSPLKRKAWLRDGDIPDLPSIVKLGEVGGHRGKWILIDGVHRDSAGDGREVQAWFTSAFIPSRGLEAIRAEFGDRIPQHRDLPEPGTDFYTFLGEVPWSEHFGSDIRRADGAPRRLFDRALDYHDGSRWRPGHRAEVPSRVWGWESYHSALNDIGSVMFPSPGLAAFHGLRSVGGSADLIDRAGRMATIFRRFEGPGFGSAYLYVRQDLIDAYAADRGLTLVTVIRGERTLQYDHLERPYPPGVQKIFQSQVNDFSFVLGMD